MKLTLALTFLFITSTASKAQDGKLRAEAIVLLERATAASVSPNLPNLERVDTFRVLDSSTAALEGTFSRVVVQGAGRRDEITFGDYHVINVFTAQGLATVRTSELVPPIVDTVLRLTPIHLVRFDDADVIRAIMDRELDGLLVRCVEFDTIVGQKIQSNELCFDPTNGTLSSEKLGEIIVQNGNFFPFAGVLIPGKIVQTYAGVPKLEISQTMTALPDAPADVLESPANAHMRARCVTYRRAIGYSLPQPKPGNGAADVDVVVRGIIGIDGQVYDAAVQSLERPDLNAEALNLIQQWVFTPATCNGRPNSMESTFVLHFRSR